MFRINWDTLRGIEDHWGTKEDVLGTTRDYTGMIFTNSCLDQPSSNMSGVPTSTLMQNQFDSFTRRGSEVHALFIITTRPLSGPWKGKGSFWEDVKDTRFLQNSRNKRPLELE